MRLPAPPVLGGVQVPRTTVEDAACVPVVNQLRDVAQFSGDFLTVRVLVDFQIDRQCVRASSDLGCHSCFPFQGMGRRASG